MSNLTVSARRRKPVRVENPPSIHQDLDGCSIPPGIERNVVLGRPVTLPFRMFQQLPPSSVLTVAACLDSACDEFADNRRCPVFGVYYSTAKIADLTGLSESSVRHTALNWLEEHRWIERTEFMVDGEVRTMIWVKWRFPHHLDRKTLDAAFGFKLEVVPEEDRVEIIPPYRPDLHARMARISAPEVAQESAPQVNTGEKSKQKTTDRENTSSSFVQVRKGGKPKPPPAPPTDDAVPPDPRIVEVIDREFADQVHRDELKARVGVWAERYGPASVMTALRELRANMAVQEITSLDGWMAKVLEDWRRKGKATPRLVKTGPTPVSADAARAEYEARQDRERREKLGVEQAKRDEQAELKARWQSLDDPGRRAVEATARARFPGLFGPRTSPTCKLKLCLTVLADDPGAAKNLPGVLA